MWNWVFFLTSQAVDQPVGLFSLIGANNFLPELPGVHTSIMLTTKSLISCGDVQADLSHIL